MDEPKGITFETAIARLEEIVRLLDDGQLSLDESLKVFEEGVGLAKACSSMLRDAQGRLQTLTANPDGTVATQELML